MGLFVGEKATKWETQDPRESCVDGLTTNGVLVMSPNGVFCPGDSQLLTSDSQNQDNNGKKSVTPAKPGLWREISVTIFLAQCTNASKHYNMKYLSISIFKIKLYLIGWWKCFWIT